jgi:hypothetical protein
MIIDALDARNCVASRWQHYHTGQALPIRPWHSGVHCGPMVVNGSSDRCGHGLCRRIRQRTADINRPGVAADAACAKGSRGFRPGSSSMPLSAHKTFAGRCHWLLAPVSDALQPLPDKSATGRACRAIARIDRTSQVTRVYQSQAGEAELFQSCAISESVVQVHPQDVVGDVRAEAAGQEGPARG